MNTISKLTLLVVFMITIPGFAEPAPWYKWRSKLDGYEICSQTSPGPGWEQSAGPYRDAHCKNLKQ